MTLRTRESSLPTSAAICGADMPVADASTIIARDRLDWYFAFLEIDRSRTPSSGDSSPTKHLRGTHAHLHARDHASWFAAEQQFPVKRSRTTH